MRWGFDKSFRLRLMMMFSFSHACDTYIHNYLHDQNPAPPISLSLSPCAAAMMYQRIYLLPLQLLLHNPECHIQHVHFLLHMRPFQSRRHTRARVPPRIHDVFPIMMLRLVQ